MTQGWDPNEARERYGNVDQPTPGMVWDWKRALGRMAAIIIGGIVLIIIVAAGAAIIEGVSRL